MPVLYAALVPEEMLCFYYCLPKSVITLSGIHHVPLYTLALSLFPFNSIQNSCANRYCSLFCSISFPVSRAIF